MKLRQNASDLRHFASGTDGAARTKVLRWGHSEGLIFLDVTAAVMTLLAATSPMPAQAAPNQDPQTVFSELQKRWCEIMAKRLDRNAGLTPDESLKLMEQQKQIALEAQTLGASGVTTVLVNVAKRLAQDALPNDERGFITDVIEQVIAEPTSRVRLTTEQLQQIGAEFGTAIRSQTVSAKVIAQIVFIINKIAASEGVRDATFSQTAADLGVVAYQRLEAIRTTLEAALEPPKNEIAEIFSAQTTILGALSKQAKLLVKMAAVFESYLSQDPHIITSPTRDGELLTFLCKLAEQQGPDSALYKTMKIRVETLMKSAVSFVAADEHGLKGPETPLEDRQIVEFIRHAIGAAVAVQPVDLLQTLQTLAEGAAAKDSMFNIASAAGSFIPDAKADETKKLEALTAVIGKLQERNATNPSRSLSDLIKMLQGKIKEF